MRNIVWWPAAASLIAVLAMLILSLNLPIKADLAMLHYCAWLINEQGFALYRDIFELNLPGPFLFHSLLGHAIGYEALPMRLLDISLLALLGWMSWRIVAPLSRPAAVFGCSLFVMLYLTAGGTYVLERDYLGLLPAIAAFLLATGASSNRYSVFCCGLLCGTACSMKPNFVVILPLLLWMSHHNSRDGLTRTGLLFITGTVLAAAIPLLWMAQQGGASEFITIYRTFVPIYASSRGDLWHYDNLTERVIFVLRNYLVYGGIACLLSIPGLVRAWRVHRHDTIAQRRLWQLALMTATMTLYEVIAGKFWFNHMFPSAYWVALCFGLLLTPSSAGMASLRTALQQVALSLPAWALAGLLGFASFQGMLTAHRQEQQAPQAWLARQVADYLLTQQLGQEERVQVLDFAGDGQAALLMARAITATRHLIDVPLYMQPEQENTQALRRELLTALQQRPPAVIVYFEQFFHPGGGNRLKEFKSLYQFLDEHYVLAKQREGGYLIYQRKDRPAPDSP